MPKWLKRGRVLYCWIDDLKDCRRTKGKWKLCILVGFDADRDELKFVLISTKISEEFARTRPGYRNAQLPLRKSDYKHFLKWDSFADCYQLSKKSLTGLVEEFEELSPTRDHGSIKKEHLDKIMALLERSDDLSPRDRRLITSPLG